MKQRLQLLVLGWLRFWAKIQLRKFAPDVIGITGSAGKTSCRNAVYAVLKDKYQTKMTYKANSESGIPLDILGIAPINYSMLDWLRMVVLAPIKIITNWQPYEKYIVEMGIDSPTPPKNMAYLLSIVKPRIAIFLNVLPVHTQFFDNIDAIALEKGKLIGNLPQNGLAVLNMDDQLVSPWATNTKAVVMGFSKVNQVDDKFIDVQITSWKVDENGTQFNFNDGTETQVLCLKSIFPEHIGQTLAAALCVAMDEDFTLKEGIDLLAHNFVIEPGRSSLIEGVNGSIIIDSSYNASPGPTLDMLELLNKFPSKRKLALLGDMRELGDEVGTKHTEVIDQAIKICDEVFLVGPLMRQYGLIDSPKVKLHWYENALRAATAIKPQLKKGDAVLVKGSQNTIFLETAVEKLMAHPNQADKLLCRRGEFWDRQRGKMITVAN
jgi:UDP-N-acetylmuramyl pentapeptide synthase